MNIALTETECPHLRQLPKQRRDDEGYVKVTVILMLNAGRATATVAQDLGLDDGTVYRYAQAWQHLGLEQCLLHERPGYWGLLPSGGLAALSREVEQTRSSDVRAIGAWLERCWSVRYSASGLTQRLHRLGFGYKLTTLVPCEADAERQAIFLADELLPLLARAEAGQALVYFADAAHPTHNTRSVRLWTRTGRCPPLAGASG
jgi:transposase